MSDVLYLLFISTIGSFIGLVGGFIFLFNKRLSKSLSVNSIPFAAGILITVSVVGLIPEAVHEIGEPAFLIVLLAFFSIYLFEHLFFGVHNHSEECKQKAHVHIHHDATIPMVIFGDTIHNFIDGVAIGAAFVVNPGLGLVTAISTLLHEIPHEIGDFGIMLRNGWDKWKIIAVNLLSASLTILGAFIVFFIPMNESIIGILMAISAGTFLYLGASDFLPQVGENGGSKLTNILPLVLGVTIMLGILYLVPHSHEDEVGQSEDTEFIEDLEHKAEKMSLSK